MGRNTRNFKVTEIYMPHPKKRLQSSKSIIAALERAASSHTVESSSAVWTSAATTCSAPYEDSIALFQVVCHGNERNRISPRQAMHELNVSAVDGEDRVYSQPRPNLQLKMPQATLDQDQLMSPTVRFPRGPPPQGSENHATSRLSLYPAVLTELAGTAYHRTLHTFHHNQESLLGPPSGTNALVKMVLYNPAVSAHANTAIEEQPPPMWSLLWLAQHGR